MATSWRQRLVGDLSWKRAGLSAALIYGTLAGYAQFLTDGQIFLPGPASYGPDPGLITLRSGDERIAARYLPNPKATYTVLFSHGNAEDLGDDADLLKDLRDMGFAVLGYDYRGYGQSTGKPSEAGAYADIDAAYGYLTGALGVPPARIIVYGRSVGSGPSVDLASRTPGLAGLILENPFMSAFRVRTVVPLLPFDKFDNLGKIGRVSAPVLVMHGTGDEVIPFFHGEAIYAAAREPKRRFWVDRAGHNEIATWDPLGYRQAIQGFASALGR